MPILFGIQQYVENDKQIEKVQMRATKLVHGFSGLSYMQRLQNLQLPTLKYRRLRGDIIELYKMVTGKYDSDASIDFKFISYLSTLTRGNKYKIFQDHVQYNLRKYFFSNRVIQIWKSMPDFVVASGTINSFKNNLDKFGLMKT